MSPEPLLQIRLGPLAREHIARNGLRAEDLAGITAAAGGPKWFVLKALDHWLFDEFLASRHSPLPLLGASIGAWRMAAGIGGGGRAIDQLAELYSKQSYAPGTDPQAVTESAGQLLSQCLDSKARQRILHHPSLRLQVLTVRSTALTQNRLATVGFGLSAVAQAIRPQWLQWGFRRHVFHHPDSHSAWLQRKGWDTQCSQLGQDNLLPALLASACIPSVMAGVFNPPDAQPGIYRDGGVSDYHIPLNTRNLDGPVLLPHFSEQLKPGWFDKFLPWRRFGANETANLIVLNPSPRFVQRLPGQRIPDRHDFLRLPDQQRRRQWQIVQQESTALADELRQWLVDGCPLDQTLALP